MSSMVDSSKLDEALAAIKKRYGKEAVMPASQKSEVVRIPFKDIQLDWATDGGVPLGRWSHFYGPESAGKSLLSLKIIANAQELGMTAAYYDVEKTFVPSWAEKMGVDLDNLYVLRPTIIEDIGNQLDALIGVVNVHVIDSIPASSPMDEIAADIEQNFIGLFARTWNKIMRRVQNSLTEENSVILINQLRTVLKKQIVTEEPAGGRFLRHEASLSLQMKKGQKLFYNKHGFLRPDGDKTKSPTEDVRPDGMEIIATAVKSKVGTPQRSARMRLDFKTGQFDELWSLAMFAGYFDMIKQNGAWYTIDGEKVQGDAGLRKYLTEHPEFIDAIRKAVLELQ